ncbi:hypothetical protein BBF96_01630 [Anoxybacter fermentans]|uniref:Uncharacterized protein n=1 Tax=Anoxybacter fermentans TaxID=1323375 RepID=A0A3Q9HNR2_9FIRM|nr:hypothetical protein [Anoxybacter fermentans]AZR72209.1 hypothetical protein BBF96_01630 [Anoxybacter fermentans]
MLMTKSMVLVVMFLAYSVVEFIFREKLKLIQRTFLLMFIILAGLFWQVVYPEHFLVVPIAGFAYFTISYFEDRLRVDYRGCEFFNLVLKQCFHIIAIYVISLPFDRSWRLAVGVHRYVKLVEIQKWEVILLVLIANIWFAPRLIRTILNDLTYRTCNARNGEEVGRYLVDEGAYRAGTLIGILERLLIIIATLLTINSGGVNIGIIGFILGTKSIARFKKFDNPEFVEYFIVGTMASILFALISIWPLQHVM